MQNRKTALDQAKKEEIKNLLRNAPSVADRQKHAAAAAAAAQKIADDAAAAQKIAADDAAQKIAADAAAAKKIDAVAAAQKIADDAHAAQKIADDAAAAQKIADDAVKVQFPLTPIYFLAHVINSTITYLFIFKFSGFWLVYQLLYVFRCFVPSCVTSIHILIPVLI